MRLLVIGVLAAALSLLLTITLFSYRADQGRIRWFSGTGIAGKVDIFGAVPNQVLLEELGSHAKTRASLAADGTFVARLASGSYRLNLPHDSRSVTIAVPENECVDLVLDYRIPGGVLRIPGEGWPIPQVAG
jgi:hypothetical protein